VSILRYIYIYTYTYEPEPIYIYLCTTKFLPQPRRLSSEDDARAGAAVQVERVVPEREERLLVERLGVDVRRHMLCADEVRDDHELLVEALDGLTSTWAVPFASLLQRNPPAAQTPCRVLAALRRPAAALRTAAAPQPKQINSLISRSTSARELLGLHAKYGKAFNFIHLATCWSRLRRVGGADRSWLRSDDGTALRALREQTTDQVRTLGAREMANTAHAIAKLALRGTQWGGLWKDLEGVALARRSELGPQGLANRAWAFATAGHAAPALFDAIGKESAGRVREFKPQALANTA